MNESTVDGLPGPPARPATESGETLPGMDRYAGRIRTLELSRDRGSVQTRDGRIIDFHAGVVRVAGMVTRADELRTGMPVTFDLGHGPQGPTVVRLWVGEGPWQAPVVSDVP
jgi:hypothetical protein